MPRHIIALILFSGIGIFSGHGEVPVSLRSLEQSLEFAGENRPELEKALTDIPGEDTEFLIRHASQYDLVNLTAELLTDNITLARKVRDAPFLENSVPEEIWREYVLPYRILEEDLGNWRPVFYEMVAPVVKDLTNTQDAAVALLDWMWKIGDEGGRKIQFRGAESRQKNPLQILEARNAKCREKNLLYVAILRAAGIPARHCMLGMHYTKSGTHWYCEYWNSKTGGWESWDGSDNLSVRALPPRTRIEEGRWNTLQGYAHPGVWSQRDLYGTRQWEFFDPIAKNLGKTFSLTVECPGSDSFTAAIHVWNMRAWRVAAYRKETASNRTTFELIQTVNREPILVTVHDGENFGWKFVEWSEGENLVSIDPAASEPPDGGLSFDAVPSVLAGPHPKGGSR